MSHNQGIQGKNVVSKSVRTGGANRKAHPSGASQLGQALGNHVTEKARILSNPGVTVFGHGNALPSKLGNEIAASTVCGVGGSRTVSRSGAQGTHGAVNPGMSRSTKGSNWPD
jgi:hypothetical protein